MPLTATLSSSPVIRSEIEPLRLAAIGGKMIERRGDEAGDAALHVDGAAAVKPVAGDLAGKRRMLHAASSPGGTTSVWPANIEIGLCRADAGVKVFDRRGAGLGEGHAVHGKSRLRQHAPANMRARRLPPASPSGSGSDRGRWRRDRRSSGQS